MLGVKERRKIQFVDNVDPMRNRTFSMTSSWSMIIISRSIFLFSHICRLSIFFLLSSSFVFLTMTLLELSHHVTGYYPIGALTVVDIYLYYPNLVSIRICNTKKKGEIIDITITTPSLTHTSAISAAISAPRLAGNKLSSAIIFGKAC